MEFARRVSVVIGSAWAAAFLAGLILRFATDLRGAGAIAVLGVVALIGGLASVRGAGELPPMTDQDRRDAIVGWGVVALLVATVAIAYVISELS